MCSGHSRRGPRDEASALGLPAFAGRIHDGAGVVHRSLERAHRLLRALLAGTVHWASGRLGAAAGCFVDFTVGAFANCLNELVLFLEVIQCSLGLLGLHFLLGRQNLADAEVGRVW